MRARACAWACACGCECVRGFETAGSGEGGLSLVYGSIPCREARREEGKQGDGPEERNVKYVQYPGSLLTAFLFFFLGISPGPLSGPEFPPGTLCTKYSSTTVLYSSTLAHTVLY